MPQPQHTIALQDAARLSGPVAFQVMVKPGGSACNLQCRYCYYLEKADLYGGREPRMSDALLEKVIREAIAANDIPEVTFTWHGGEPLLAGPGFFRRAMELQRRYAGGKTIRNTLQTNGTLITPDWAAFFRDNGFLVGLSLDGPADIHDAYRKDRGGRPTFPQVMRGLENLLRAGTEFNTLSTVNRRSEGRGAEVYRFLKSLGSKYMQFLPVAEPGNPPYNVSGLGYGRFMCEIFDEWLKADVGTYYVNLFDATLASWCGVQPGTCVWGRSCGDSLTVEHNGDVYACDHFVDEVHRLGNLADSSFREMIALPQRIRFVTDKYDTLPAACRRCPWLPACNGECPQHRFVRSGSGRAENALCDGYKLFFSHAAPYMDVMRKLLAAGEAPAGVMAWARLHPQQ